MNKFVKRRSLGLYPLVSAVVVLITGLSSLGSDHLMLRLFMSAVTLSVVLSIVFLLNHRYFTVRFVMGTVLFLLIQTVLLIRVLAYDTVHIALAFVSLLTLLSVIQLPVFILKKPL